MQYITNKHIPSTITSKGQITLPIEVRRYLGVDTNDKVDFVITDTGDVLLTVPHYRSIAALRGAAGKLPTSHSEQELETTIAEEIAENAANEG
jgi:AbrB family looped-hinge helix DNA binding protein